mgnify:CR=1 FL=1
MAALHKQHTLLAVTSGKQVLDILSVAGDEVMDCGTPLQNVNGLPLLQLTAAPAHAIDEWHVCMW